MCAGWLRGAPVLGPRLPWAHPRNGRFLERALGHKAGSSDPSGTAEAFIGERNADSLEVVERRRGAAATAVEEAVLAPVDEEVDPYADAPHLRPSPVSAGRVSFVSRRVPPGTTRCR